MKIKLMAKSKAFRGIALFLSVCMLLIDIQAYATPLPVNPKALKSLSQEKPLIPKELGTVDLWVKGKSDKRIIYIQDAHDNLEAQENIARMIQYLVKERDIESVFEEGFEGEVPTDKFFGGIKDTDTKFKVSHHLLDQLQIGGAEFAHINRKKEFKLIGADSIDLLIRNVDWYKQASREMEAINVDLKVFRNELNLIIQKEFPKAIKSWLKLKNRFEQSEIELLDYLKRTLALFKESPIHDFPMIALILAADATKDENILKTVQSIDAVRLFKEINSIELALAKVYLRNDNQIKVFDYYRGIELLKRLSRLELSSEEFEALEINIRSYKTREIAEFIATHENKSMVISKQWEESIEKSFQFYKAAKSRDSSIDNRIDEFLENKAEKEAVLVYGGFHKDAIKKILSDKDVSFAIITPRISGEDPIHTKRYKVLMSEGYEPPESRGVLNKAMRYSPAFFKAKFKPDALREDIQKLTREFRSKELVTTNIRVRSESREKVKKYINDLLSFDIKQNYEFMMLLREIEKENNGVRKAFILEMLKENISSELKERVFIMSQAFQSFKNIDILIKAIKNVDESVRVWGTNLLHDLLFRDSVTEDDIHLITSNAEIFLKAIELSQNHISKHQLAEIYGYVLDTDEHHSIYLETASKYSSWKFYPGRLLRKWKSKHYIDLILKLSSDAKVAAYYPIMMNDLALLLKEHPEEKTRVLSQIRKNLVTIRSRVELEEWIESSSMGAELEIDISKISEGDVLDLITNFLPHLEYKVYLTGSRWNGKMVYFLQKSFQYSDNERASFHTTEDVLFLNNNPLDRTADLSKSNFDLQLRQRYSMGTRLVIQDRHGLVEMAEYVTRDTNLVTTIRQQITRKNEKNVTNRLKEIFFPNRSETRDSLEDIWKEIEKLSGLKEGAEIEFNQVSPEAELQSSVSQIDYQLQKLSSQEAKALVYDGGIRILLKGLGMSPFLWPLRSSVKKLIQPFIDDDENQKKFEIHKLKFKSLVKNEIHPKLNTVHAHYYLPKDQKKGRAPPILVPSFRHFDAYSRLFAIYFSSLGIPVLEVTMAGFGERSPEGIAEKARQWEKYEHLNLKVDEYISHILHSVIDLHTTIKWLKNRDEIDAKQVNLIGVSLAAKVATITHLIDKSSASLTAIVPVVDIATVFWAGAYKAVGKLIEKQGYSQEEFSEAMKMINLESLASSYEGDLGKLLLIAVEDDELVPSGQTKQLHEKLGSPKVIAGKGEKKQSAHLTGFVRMLPKILKKTAKNVRTKGNTRSEMRETSEEVDRPLITLLNAEQKQFREVQAVQDGIFSVETAEEFKEHLAGRFILKATRLSSPVFKTIEVKTTTILVHLNPDEVKKDERLLSVSEKLKEVKHGYGWEKGEIGWLDTFRVTDKNRNTYLFIDELQVSKKYWKFSQRERRAVRRWRQEIWPDLEKMARKIGAKGIILPTGSQMAAIYEEEIADQQSIEEVLRASYRLPSAEYKEEEMTVTLWTNGVNLNGRFWVNHFDNEPNQMNTRSEVRGSSVTPKRTQEEISRAVSFRRDHLYELVLSLPKPHKPKEILELFKQKVVDNEKPFLNVTMNNIIGDFRIDHGGGDGINRFTALSHKIQREISTKEKAEISKVIRKEILAVLDEIKALAMSEEDFKKIDSMRVTPSKIVNLLKLRPSISGDITLGQIYRAINAEDKIRQHEFLKLERVERIHGAIERREALWDFIENLDKPGEIADILNAFRQDHQEYDDLKDILFENDIILDDRYLNHPNIEDLDSLQRASGIDDLVEQRRKRSLKALSQLEGTYDLKEVHKLVSEIITPHEVNYETFKTDLRRDPRFWVINKINYGIVETDMTQAIRVFITSLIHDAEEPMNLTQIIEAVMAEEPFKVVSKDTVVTVLRGYKEFHSMDGIILEFDTVSKTTKLRRKEIIKYLNSKLKQDEYDIDRVEIYNYIRELEDFQGTTFHQVAGDSRNDSKIRKHEAIRAYGREKKGAPKPVFGTPLESEKPQMNEAEERYNALLKKGDINSLSRFYHRHVEVVQDQILDVSIDVDTATEELEVLTRIARRLMAEKIGDKARYKPALEFIANVIEDTYGRSIKVNLQRSEIRYEVIRGGKVGYPDEGWDLLALVDKDKNRLKYGKKKADVHRDGDWHETAQVYLIDKRGNVLLQKRSSIKDISPGKLQVSAGGHVDLTDKDHLSALLRESSEELGILLDKRRTIPLTKVNEIERSNESDGKINNEFTTLYYYVVNDEEIQQIKSSYNLNEIDEFQLAPLSSLKLDIEQNPHLFSHSLKSLVHKHSEIYRKMMTFFYGEEIKEMGFEVVEKKGKANLKYLEDYSTPELSYNLLGLAHGETDNNVRHVLHGRRTNNDDSHLNKNGKEQALAGAESLWQRIGNRWEEDPSKFVFITSELTRAHQTAAIYQEYFEARSNQKFVTIEDNGINEIDFGLYDGLAEDEILEQFGKEALALVRSYRAGDIYANFPEGQNYINFVINIRKWLLGNNEKYTGKTVVLFGHGTYMNALDIILKTDAVTLKADNVINHRAHAFMRGVSKKFYSKGRSELRQGTLQLQSDVVFAISQADLDELPEAQWLELLGRKATNKDYLHLHITDDMAKRSERLEALMELGQKVYTKFQFRNLPEKALIIHFSPMNQEGVLAAEIDEELAVRIQDHYFSLYNGAFGTALLYSLGNGQLRGLEKKNGKWFDPHNLYIHELEQFFKSYEIISIAA